MQILAVIAATTAGVLVGLLAGAACVALGFVAGAVCALALVQQDAQRDGGGEWGQ